MLKPELLVTPRTIEDIKHLIEAGADAFILGEERFGLRLAGEFPLDTLAEAVSLIKAHQKKVYIAINAVYANAQINPLREYIEAVSKLDIDALRFSDPGAFMVAREVAPHLPLHWSSETLGTNYFTANYWTNLGVVRTVLAPELMKEAVLETSKQTTGEIEIQVHGAICMFQSRRELIGNYLKFQGQVVKKVKTKAEGFELYDPERELYYPIFEDLQGTHIFNGTDVCMIDDLQDFINAKVTSLRIDGILKSSDYILTMTKAYRQAIDLAVTDRELYEKVGRGMYKTLESFQPKNRQLDRGFFYKPSMYKHK